MKNMTVQKKLSACVDTTIRAVVRVRTFFIVGAIVVLCLYFGSRLDALTTTSGSEDEHLTCHLPVLERLEPFNLHLTEVNSDPGPHNCSDPHHPLLFKTDFESNLLQVGDPSKFGYFNCCYQSFKRTSPGWDNIAEWDPRCTPIKTARVRVSQNMDFIRVNCSKTINGIKTSVPVDFFGFVHLKPGLETKIWEIEKRAFNTTREQRVNVVILGVDSVSHMNFQRVMPRTREYLVRNLAALSLNGYTRVGGNTFPNLVPLLMGKTVREISEGCWKNNSHPFDPCPFIWKNFKAKGYRTAYGEDATSIGIFNYIKRGFQEVPTDYYFNGLTYQLDKTVGHKMLEIVKICYGPRLGFSISLDFLQKMAVRMNRTRRYFHFIWATSMTHDRMMQGKQGDQPLLETLKWFKDEGYLEDTVLILMSDHGIRYGRTRSTIQGQYETNMPFAYFILPGRFKKQYPAAVSNILQNRDKLVTPFDMYETLLDLSDLERISEEGLKGRQEKLKKQRNLPQGISLFLPIPPSRSCEDAGIPEQYCVCRELQPVELRGNSLIQEGARHTVHRINGVLRKYPQCSPLVLERILSAQLHGRSSTKFLPDVSANITRADDPRLAKRKLTFSLSVVVRPSRGSFEATTTRQRDGSWEVNGEISRTNLYGNQSWCVADYEIKPFCYCN